MQFDGQHEGEEVFFFFRKHPIVLRKAFLVSSIIFVTTLAPFSFYPLNSIAQMVAVIGFLISAAVMLYYWANWYYSIYIVTNLRIIQDKQKGLFGKQVVQVDLDKIQNINYEVPGLQATLFKFGTLVVQTFVGDLIIDYIHNPSKIQQRLTEIVRDAGGFNHEQIT